MRLTARDLTISRSDRIVFENLSFTLGDGETLIVTGRNGAGKSTLLALLAGRLRADSGTIEAEGIGENALAESLHLIGHKDGLKTALTAAENLSFAYNLLEPPSAANPETVIRQALETVGMAAQSALPVAWLSAGQRRRVALARLLVAHRPLWLLDEPSVALDEASERILTRLMNDHLAKGGLIVAATHAPLALKGTARHDLDLSRFSGRA